jgi:hypothetical protein
MNSLKTLIMLIFLLSPSILMATTNAPNTPVNSQKTPAQQDVTIVNPRDTPPLNERIHSSWGFL